MSRIPIFPANETTFPQTQRREALVKLRAIVSAILDSPCDERPRRLNCGGNTWRWLAERSAGGHDGLLMFFTAELGFQRCPDNRIELPPRASLVPLRSCLDALLRDIAAVESEIRCEVERREADQLRLQKDAVEREREARVQALAHHSTSARSDNVSAASVWLRAQLPLRRDGVAEPPSETVRCLRRIGGGDVNTVVDALKQLEAELFDEENSSSALNAERAQALTEANRRHHRSTEKTTRANNLSQELLLTATRLVNDVAGLMHQYSVLEGRQGYVRNDRIEAQRLLDQFNADGNIETLHAAKEHWERQLAALKASKGQPVVYLSPASSE